MDLREVLKVTKVPLPDLLERETLVEVKVSPKQDREEEKLSSSSDNSAPFLFVTPSCLSSSFLHLVPWSA